MQQFQLSTASTVISVWRTAHNRFIKAAVRSSLIGCHSLAAIEMFARRKGETVKKREKKRDEKRCGIYDAFNARMCFNFQSLLLRRRKASRLRLPCVSVKWRKKYCRTIELLIVSDGGFHKARGINERNDESWGIFARKLCYREINLCAFRCSNRSPHEHFHRIIYAADNP